MGGGNPGPRRSLFLLCPFVPLCRESAKGRSGSGWSAHRLYGGYRIWEERRNQGKIPMPPPCRDIFKGQPGRGDGHKSLLAPSMAGKEKADLLLLSQEKISLWILDHLERWDPVYRFIFNFSSLIIARDSSRVEPITFKRTSCSMVGA